MFWLRAPHGSFTAYTMGNQVQRTFGYTSRLQMASAQDSLNGATLLQLTNGWQDARGMANNGNLYSQTITGGGLTFNQHFGYDAVNRLSTAQELSTAEEGNRWLRRFGYDAFGNMYVSQVVGMQLSSFTPASASWFAGNNRLSNPALGIVYDKGVAGPGNLTAIGGYTFEYDAENRQTSAAINNSTTAYKYDGEGRRVQKCQDDGTGTCLANGAVHVYVYDVFGQLAAEYHNGTTSAAPCGTCYLSFDHLGSTRLVTNEQGQIVARHDYLPFGEEIKGVGGRTAVWGGADTVNQKFTAKERDQETGLDFFGARYMSSAQGRWTSPDLLNLTEARLVNPANTLNKYIYGGNNPLKYVDPDGLEITLFYRPVQSTFDPNDWGHVFIGAYNQQSSEVQFLDFYPDGQLNGLSGPGTFNDGTFSEREGRFASITVQTTPEIAQQVIDLIKDIQSHPQQYAFPFKTCTTVCNTALKLVGMGSPATLTPQGLWNTWLNRYTSQRPQSFDGKSFLPPPPQVSPGVDYGNPRTNAFDWQHYLFDLWRNQPKQACVEAGGEKTCDAF